MFVFIIFGTLLLDQASKAVVQMLMYHGESIPVAPPVFYLTYILNPGAAFGILAHRTPIFITVTILLAAGVLLGYKKLPPERRLLRYGLGLVVGGALGNLADRLRCGFVVDFLDFRVWPVFNLADIAIVTGACFLVWELLKNNDKKPEKERGI
ncbi:MAG: Lipoprotein signal peptidase [Pelotomaculum sp. PtaU1.Bin035]|nr:MAG: Lipoprotein signal peptidase [Pelotomaculum sp. PtaU1.Bin035]